jgi:hypothetical protein
VKRILLSVFAAFICIALFSKVSTAEITMTFFINDYKPKIALTNQNEYNGKKIMLESISIEASGYPPITYTYQSDDGKITYNMGTRLSSHLWYYLRKSFESVGLTVKEPANTANMPQVAITILAFSDSEAKFTVNLVSNGNDLFEKEYIVKTNPLPSSYGMSDIEVRAYSQFDAMASAFLNDPGFKKAFSTKKK